MFFCRGCNADFDVIRHRPLVLPCGHTFCKVCLTESFASTAKFDCLNCTFTATNFEGLVPNLILTDPNSHRSLQISTQPTLVKNQLVSSFFRSPAPIQIDVPFAQRLLQQVNSSKNVMEVEGKNEEVFQDNFRGFSVKGEDVSGNSDSTVCSNHLCRAKDPEGKCSGRCRNNSTTKRNLGNSSLRQSSPNHSHFTPTKPRPFALPSDPRLTSFHPLSSLKKPVFNSPGFGLSGSGSKRCSRVGCLNTKHSGFGEGFPYCSLNCHRMAEGREYAGYRI